MSGFFLSIPYVYIYCWKFEYSKKVRMPGHLESTFWYCILLAQTQKTTKCVPQWVYQDKISLLQAISATHVRKNAAKTWLRGKYVTFTYKIAKPPTRSTTLKLYRLWTWNLTFFLRQFLNILGHKVFFKCSVLS